MQLLPRSCRLPRQLGAQLLWLILRTQLRTCAHGHVQLPVTRRGQPAATTAADVHDPNARTATHSLVLSSETECLCIACRQCNPIDFTTHCSHADCAPCDGCEEAVRFRDTAACAMWCDQSNAASHCPDDRCADCGFCQASSSTSSHGTAAAISPASRRANMALPSVPPSLYVPHTRPGAPCAPGTAPSHSGKIAKMPKPRGLLHLAVCMHMYTASRSLLQPPALS